MAQAAASGAYLSLPETSHSLPYLTQSSSFTSSDCLAEPLSPLDPYIPSRPGRQTQGTEFFSAVYLDSPSIGPEVGGTRPLRVRKKGVSARYAGVGHVQGIRHRRRSTLSLPRSPRSPRSTISRDASLPTSPLYRSAFPTRSNTQSSSNSSIHPHHSISRLFLATSPPVMYPLSPPPPVPTVANVPSRAARRNQRACSQSELHLGLGGFTTYDESARPGPSPPQSPMPSPVQRRFVLAPSKTNRIDARRNKGLPRLPASPLTPSRAPPKAAALLGAGYTTPAPRVQGSKTKRKEHFRPLPTQTLVEIERFFGAVPKKPSKTPQGLKARPRHSRTGTNAKTTNPTTSTGDGLGDRKVGEGSTVRHQGEDGSMWLDVEEEQEFAWLMSEIFSVAPLPLPPIVSTTTGCEGKKGMEKMYEQGTDDEDPWGMDSFVSVLHMARPKVEVVPKGAIAKQTNTLAKRGKKGNDESFMDFGDAPQHPSKTSRKKVPLEISESIHPWAAPTNRFTASTSALEARKPSYGGLSNDQTTHAGSSSEPELIGSSPPRSESPPRIRNRPPPLTLRAQRVKQNLPTISTTPSASNRVPPSYHVPTPAPATPFAHPRRAPIPGFRSNTEIPPVPFVPALPSQQQYMMEEEQEISFFEPETPVEPRPKHQRVLSDGATAAAAAIANAGNVANKGVSGVKNGGAWLRKFVKPLAGSIRV